MKIGEGIVGHCFQNLRPVCEGKAVLNPHFKRFEEAGEDRFKSFMVVPIHRGAVRIGAIVVEHERPDVFEEAEIMALRAASSQLASSIENARLLMEVKREEGAAPAEHPPAIKSPLKAEIASEGIAYGPVTVFRRSSPASLIESSPEDASLTLEDFRRAVDVTAEQLQSLQSQFAKRLPESASLIFTTHFMMLKDESFVGRMAALIEQGTNPLHAVSQVSGHYTALFLANPHEYVREKANDVEDLTLRILRNLKRPGSAGAGFGSKRIVIASQLYPSDILKLVANDTQGVILVGGGATAHISILSRSLHIPLLMASQHELLSIPEDTPVLMDGYMGNIYIRPSQRVIKGFKTRENTRLAAIRRDKPISPVTRTSDGEEVGLLANINLLSEIPLAKELKAQGVGLYRTEFPFLIRSTFPSETEQYLVYKRLFDEMKNHTVTVRTLDVGGEKVLAYLDTPPEANPELGMRSIRFSLDRRDVFETQIRAILRAAHGSRDARIMFPMISSVDEFLEARRIVLDCMKGLKKEHLPYNSAISIGMMVELPSIGEIIDSLSEVSDFFAIGTNDFIQYMLAADRTNQRVARYYAAHHPAVLRGLYRVVEAARGRNREVSICGEMAHEISHLPFLLGIGIRSFSVDPQFLPALQEAVSKISIPDAVEYAKLLLSKSSLRDTLALMEDGAWKKRFGRI
jgi:phosphotransferase system enzyme I (PtsP)